MTDQRADHRVVFERGHQTQMMGIDGTWRRDCSMEDVSEGGAKTRSAAACSRAGATASASAVSSAAILASSASKTRDEGIFRHLLAPTMDGELGVPLRDGCCLLQSAKRRLESP